MTRHTASIPDGYFEALYSDGRDPWHFATSAYEHGKYAATLAALGPGRFARAWEVGCAIGVFTSALAGRCESLLAVDVSDNALAQARARCAGLRNVRLRRMRVPEQWAIGTFDLIIFSEMLYYLAPQDVRRTARRALASLAPGGQVLLVHWIGETDYPCTGDEVVDLFTGETGPQLRPLRRGRNDAYRLDLLQRA